MDAPALSLVLPCFNEEANAEHTIREALAWLDREGIHGEVIAVNDGSRDYTGKILERLSWEDARVKIVTHTSNQGYGLAIRSGCDRAAMEAVAFVDSDGQFCVSDLSLLLAHMHEVPFVAGRRAHRADSFVRNMLGKALGAANVLIHGLWVRDVNCGMKIFKRDLWSSVRPVYGVEKMFNTELFLRLKHQGIGWKTINVPHYPRRAGNPTGAKWYVILRMFKELWDLRKIA